MGSRTAHIRDVANNATSRVKVYLSDLFQKRPSKKILLFVLIILSFLLILMLLFVVFNIGETTKIKDKPTFLFDIAEGEKDLKSPLGVATSDECIYIADTGNARLVVFDLKGHFLYAINMRDNKGKKDSYPVGVAVNDVGEIYVTDLYEPMIRVFSKDGKFKENFPNSSYSLKKPLALAYFGSKLYVTDIGDQTVKVFDRGGKLLNKFGQPGKKEGQFGYPNGIAVADDGTVFVADSNNGRIQVFDERGKFIRAFGDELSIPKGVAIDGLNRVLVADALIHKIFVFNEKGKLLFSFSGEGVGRLSIPYGIAIDRETCKLYITDKGKDCIAVWEY